MFVREEDRSWHCLRAKRGRNKDKSLYKERQICSRSQCLFARTPEEVWEGGTELRTREDEGTLPILGCCGKGNSCHLKKKKPLSSIRATPQSGCHLISTSRSPFPAVHFGKPLPSHLILQVAGGASTELYPLKWANCVQLTSLDATALTS